MEMFYADGVRTTSPLRHESGVYLKAMKRSTERFLTTHVGSMVRPKKITQYFQALAAKEAVDTPAFEAELSTAVAEVVKRAPGMRKSDVVIVNISGRGDKDMGILAQELDLKGSEAAKG